MSSLRRIWWLATSPAAGAAVASLWLVLDVADRAYLLVNGRVVSEGRTEELRANVGEIESKYLGVH